MAANPREHYIRSILEFDPERLDELLAARRAYIGLAGEGFGGEAGRSDPWELAQRREWLVFQLDCLHGCFWSPTAVPHFEVLSSSDLSAFPALKRRFDRLARVFPLRDRFASAGSDSRMNADFLVWFRRLAVANERQAALLRSFHQGYLQDRGNLVATLEQVRLLQNAYPELFELERDWFVEILDRPARYWKTVF